MNRDDRQGLRTTILEVSGWVEQARRMLEARTLIERDAAAALNEIRRSVVNVQRDGRPAWHVLPLGADNDDQIRSIARRRHLPPLGGQDQDRIAQLSAAVPAAVKDANALLGARRLFSGRAKKDAGAEAATYLTEYQAWGTQTELLKLIDRLTPRWDGARLLMAADALSDEVGLATGLPEFGLPELIDATPAHGLRDAINAIAKAVKHEAVYQQAAIKAGDDLRHAEARRMLSTMPVERLKEATGDRLRIAPLTSAGITTVQAVLDFPGRLDQIPGIGATSAPQLKGAAHTLRQTTYDEMPARIDIKNRTREATEFLRRLGEWDAARKLKNAASDLSRADELTGLARSVTRSHTRLLVFRSGQLDTQEFLAGVHAVVSRAAHLGAASASTGTAAPDPWDDFLSRPADYFGMLTELGFVTEDENKTHGDLPEEIIEAVRAMSLNTEHLSVSSLRGYQSFAARFALVQRKVIIGDEMGLGKTVEALAVLAHLRSQGRHHAIVICPAAVVTNWVREISSKSNLRAHRVHGPGRDQAVRNWLRNGGVAVTTFETLAWFIPQLGSLDVLGCVVVDEAHYIKNPAAKRSLNATHLMEQTDRTVLLTGTPLENHLDEFANLVRYLRPDLVVDTSGLSPRVFRKQVAPAYLRRNQEDVLTELPELVEVEEFVPFSTDDYVSYRDAVAQGNFMAMRQAALTQGHRSEKMRRLLAIVQEAEDNDRRILVFSHFREVLNQVTKVLPGRVFGPLTGSVAAVERQRMVDEFSAAPHGAVLVSQIVAGGVGLNIQAASVVVICEPQLKPTTEWQAIARARRMGQLESVQVHRLLSEEGVDQRVTEILARKSALFDDFARVSATANSAPEAFDITEAELAREVVAAERERLFSQPGTEATEEVAS
jgi:ERCC4-related helicase